MKASPRQQQLLLDLQELDTLEARLRKQRGAVPERAEYTALEEQHATLKERFMAAQRELDTQQAELERVESDVQLVVDRRRRDEELLSTDVSSKEAQSLQRELELLGRRQTELEDRELEMMEQLEKTQATFDAARLALEQIDDERARLRDRIVEAEESIDAAVRRNREERELLAAELQREVLELYEATRARTGLGAARLRGNVSEGSNMTVAPGELAAIRAADPDEIVFCPDSGAILVRIDDE